MVDGREVGVEPICVALKKAGVQIAPSSYYAAKTWPPSARTVRDAHLVEDIKVAHKANLAVYGAGRFTFRSWGMCGREDSGTSGRMAHARTDGARCGVASVRQVYG